MIELRSYQKRILEELATMPSIGLFMGTGTGKTITSLFRANDNGTSHLMVICPSKVIQQWEAVIIKDFPEYHILPFKASWTASKKEEYLATYGAFTRPTCVIVSVESVAAIPSLWDILNEDWTLIVDESHKIKELGTKRKPIQRTHAVLALGQRTSSKIILTATPTQKDKGGYIDYFSQLQFLGYFQGWSVKDFKDRYCILQKLQTPGMPYPIEVIKGYKNTGEIDAILQATCRRYVATFGDFEPQHTTISIPKTKSYSVLVREKWYEDLDLTNLSARRMAKKTLTTGTVLGHDIYKERRIYDDNKHKIEWVKEFLEDTDETVVIFYKYNVELANLTAMCVDLGKKFIIINGATKDKYAEVNKKNYDVVIGQFGAAGESLDGLQHRSHICIYFAMPESSLEYTQAMGRINRDGQKLVPMYYYLLMEGSIDEDIYAMIQSKIEFSEETLNRLEVQDND